MFVPGVMGSELVDRDGTVVWGMNPRPVATVVEVYEHGGAPRERAVASAVLYPSTGGTAAAELALPRPGLYRVSVAHGGYSPVEHLVLAVESRER